MKLAVRFFARLAGAFPREIILVSGGVGMQCGEGGRPGMARRRRSASLVWVPAHIAMRVAVG